MQSDMAQQVEDEPMVEIQQPVAQQSEQPEAMEQDEPQEPLAPPSLNRQISLDPQILSLMTDRKHNYSEAAKYMLQVIGNKDQALVHLSSAESLKKIIKEYQNSGKADVKKLPPMITPEILFGISDEEKVTKLEELISIYRTDFEELQQKAKTCLAGTEKLKKQE